MAIPKKIHYVWLGDKPLPEQDAEYIEGWKRLNPEFEICHWTEKDLDISSYPLVGQALENKRWALASDIIRMHVIYHEGGIYLDTDIELLKPLKPFLKYDGFAGWEANYWFTTAAFGAKQGSPWIEKVLKRYEKLPADKKITSNTFMKTVHSPSVYAQDIYGIELDGKTREYMEGRFATFASEYFAPKHYITGEVHLTKNTVAYHHYASTWHTRRERLQDSLLLMAHRAMRKKDYEKLEKMYNRVLEKEIRKELP